MRFCTIVAANYLPYARVLADSLREHCPDDSLTVLVVDDAAAAGGSTEPFQVLATVDLPLAPSEVWRMAAIYDVTEFATALKPWLLERLVRESPEPVAYLDPDIRVYAPLTVVAESVERHGLTFTPHTLAPMPRDGLHPDELDILISGTYNLGFVALDARALPFLAWWQERLRRDCLHQVDVGLFVDQRWVDLAVHYFPYDSLRDPGCNVAYWNVDARPVQRTSQGFTVGDGPLRFFHFSGFRPDNPTVLSRHHVVSARLDPSSSESLQRLCAEYAAALVAAGYSSAGMGPYAFDSSAGGLLLTKRLRRRYRADLLAGRELPNPFAAEDSAAFRSWVRGTRSWDVVAGSHLPRGVRVLAKALDDPRTARNVLRSKLGRPGRQRPQRPGPGSAAQAGGLGANVVGYFRAEDGVGHGARAVAAALAEAAVPYAVAVSSETRSSQNAVPPSGDGRQHPVDLVCVNADMLPSVLAKHRSEHPCASYTVGIWAWEIADFPASMRASADLVDEVWTLSRHSADAIAPVIDKPVLVFPFPLLPEPVTDGVGPDLGVPEGFRFLFCFDAHSIVARKNPVGVASAFRRAFEPGAGPQLVIKAVNGSSDSEAMRELRQAMSGRDDMHLLVDQLSPGDQAALMRSADCYVSLHRAEGQGLTMLEAMRLGTPVIATGYSGNLDFMTVANSYLVPYELAAIPAGCEPYPKGALWAEPDLDEAARLMKRVMEHPGEAAALGARGRRDVLETMVPAARARFLRERFAHIQRVLDAS